MAGGYTHSDAEAEHALIVNENAVNAVMEVLAIQRSRPSALVCKDPWCGEDIPEARRQAVPGVQYCVECAPKHQIRVRKIKMLDNVL
jgi:hypothetical protein